MAWAEPALSEDTAGYGRDSFPFDPRVELTKGRKSLLFLDFRPQEAGGGSVEIPELVKETRENATIILGNSRIELKMAAQSTQALHCAGFLPVGCYAPILG